MSGIAKIGSTEYATLALAANAVLDGQTVDIVRSGEATEVTAPFVKPGTFRIIGQKDATGAIPKLQIDMYTRPAFGKAIINLEDGNYEIAYLHLDGCSVPDSNGAAIRVNPGTDIVHIHHVKLTNNENGILTAGGANFVYINDAVIDSNGKALDSSKRGYSHNIYAGASARIEATRVSFTNSPYGHDFKSRAAVNILTQVLCEGSANGRALDLSNGGVLLATDCKFSKLASAIQNNLIDIAPEGVTPGREERYEFTNCHFHNDVSTLRDVQYIKNRSTKEVVLIDPLFTGAAALKDRKATLVGNIRVVLTGGPLGPRLPVGGDPSSSMHYHVPMPPPSATPPTSAPTAAPTAAPTQAPTVAPTAAPTPTPVQMPSPTQAPTQPPTTQVVSNESYVMIPVPVSTKRSSVSTVTVTANPETGLASVKIDIKNA